MLLSECRLEQRVIYPPFSNTLVCIISDLNARRSMETIQIREERNPSNSGWVQVSQLELIPSLDNFIITNSKHNIKIVSKV